VASASVRISASACGAALAAPTIGAVEQPATVVAIKRNAMAIREARPDPIVTFIPFAQRRARVIRDDRKSIHSVAHARSGSGRRRECYGQ